MFNDIMKMVKDICRNLGVRQQYFDDLVQEVLMILLEMDYSKVEEMYKNKQLNFFLTRIIKNQYLSTTSPFYKKYRKQYEYYDGNITSIIMQEQEEDDDGCAEDE